MSANSPTPIAEPIKQWLDTLPKTMPLTAVKHPAEQKALRVLLSDAKLARDPLVKAMLGLRIGEIDQPHVIVQNDPSPLGSYLHGVVHRLEQDFWNSKYWFRQIRDVAVLSSISRIVSEILTDNGMADAASQMGILKGSQFQPVEFVTACEQASGNSKRSEQDLASLERVGYAEWLALWNVVNFDDRPFRS